MYSRNQVPEFHYASALLPAGQALLPAYSTAAAKKIKRIKVTDLKMSAAGTACTVEIGGDDSNYNSLQLRIATGATVDLSWQLPFPVDCVSSTGATREIYASASGYGVRVAISGYVDHFD